VDLGGCLVIDYDLVRLMHRHGDSWESLELIEGDGPGGKHGSAAHDPERSPDRWARIYRCSTCAEEFAIGTGDAPTTGGGPAQEKGSGG
jgi:hypothetical protein